MTSLKQWWKKFTGVRCGNCGGLGYTEGHSGSLSTFRPWVRWSCSWCSGSGRLSIAKASEYEEKSRAYEASWHQLAEHPLGPLYLHPDPRVVAQDLGRLAEVVNKPPS